MSNIILKDERIKFNDIEKVIYGMACEAGIKLMSEILEKLDDELYEKRDKKRYRYKFKTKKTIQTVMGDLKFSRRYYVKKGVNGGIYLLDEALELDIIGRTSQNLIEKIIDNAIVKSYRKSAEAISNTTATTVSHQTIKNKIDYIGDRLKAQENERITQYLQGELKGEREVKVLFEEKDGVFLSIQGQKSKKELKLAKVYEGWTKNNSTYKTVNTMYFAGYEDGEIFDNLVNSGIAKVYDESKIELTVLNGDGAPWISAEVEDNAQMVYQLDLFHIYQKASRKIKEEVAREEIKKLIREGKYEEVLLKHRELIDNEKDEKTKEGLTEAYNYYQNNFEALTRYKDRKDITVPPPPEGIEYRGLGTMESSIRNVIAMRMKDNGTSWSINGANNMSKLLCLKHSGNLYEKLQELLDNNVDIDLVDIKKIIKEQLDEAKKVVNNEVRTAIREQKHKRKYNESIQSTIIYGGGKVTKTKELLKGLTSSGILTNII